MVLLALVAACAVSDDAPGPSDGEVCGNDVCEARETPESCPWDCGFRYALITDQLAGASGASPGVDLDAVELVLTLGEPQFAQAVVASVVQGADNDWTDPTQALGVPDSSCEANFVSLGGLGAYIVLDFGRPIRKGDALTIYEVGSRMCGSGTDDGWELSVTNSSDPFDAEYIRSGAGKSTVEVDW